MSARTHWDPFEGQINISTPEPTPEKSGFKLPMWLQRFLPLACLISFLALIVEGIIGGGFPVFATIATTISMAALLLTDNSQTQTQNQTNRRLKIAKHRNWSYTSDLMARRVRYVATETSEGVRRRSILSKSARAEKIEAQLPELTKVQVGAFMGAIFDGEFWGETESDNTPFWLAIGATQVEAGLAANKSLRTDNYGGSGGYGQFYTLLAGYKLKFDTKFRAVVQPQNVFKKGPFDKDLKLGNPEFDNVFGISGAYDEDDYSQITAIEELKHILRPAVQSALLSMHKRFHKVGFILEDDVIYFMVQDKLMGKNAKDENIDHLLEKIVTEFEFACLNIVREHA